MIWVQLSVVNRLVDAYHGFSFSCTVALCLKVICYGNNFGSFKSWVMTTSFFNSWKPVVLSWIYVVVMIFVIVLMVGKQTISWVLMKLYEFFIQRSPV